MQVTKLSQSANKIQVIIRASLFWDASNQTDLVCNSDFRNQTDLVCNQDELVCNWDIHKLLNRTSLPYE